MGQNEAIDPLLWARSEAEALRQYDVHAASFRDGRRPNRVSRGRMASVVEFLRVHAGPDNYLTNSAREYAESSRCTERAHDAADLLLRWAEFEEGGLSLPFEVRARIAASTDLMEQVEALLRDSAVHPAAPIVLTGAALEERLRSLADQQGVSVSGQGLDAYGTALKKANVINGQEAKQITAWAGLRNQAAHGQGLDELTKSQAVNMADGVNLFLQKYSI